MSKPNPSDLRYTKEHEWVKIEGDTALMGITDHAQELLTDIVFAELPEIGKQAEKMKPLAVVESVKSVSDVYAPVSGEVIEVNTALEAKPELINQDAFGQGWIAKIKMSNSGEAEELMTASQYDDYVKSQAH